jgi:hypothetical protein
MKNIVGIIFAVLLSGCTSNRPQKSIPKIFRPITVTGCEAVLERTNCLAFRTSDNKTFELTNDWYGETPVLYLNGDGYHSGNITRHMPIRNILIDSLQEFLDSKVTSSQLRSLYKKGRIDYKTLSKEEKNILGAKSYIEGLKRIEEEANKSLEDTSQ